MACLIQPVPIGAQLRPTPMFSSEGALPAGRAHQAGVHRPLRFEMSATATALSSVSVSCVMSVKTAAGPCRTAFSL
jgi:hypothetical protein